jgi:GNAT superfamily N-acetyltransferase
MSVEDLRRVLDWAAEEGWNPGLDDAAAFHAADPEGFFLAEIEGRPVAAISVVNHDDAFAFLGLYLCVPEHRGRGVGFGLWRHALDHAGSRTVGLDGVPAQQANYARSGFARAGATTRWRGAAAISDAAPRTAVRPAEDRDLPAMIALEAQASGWSKPRYLSAWFAAAPSRTSFVLAEGGGLATVRRCCDGAKIGPLIAPDPDGALALIRRCADWAEAPITLDVPDSSATLTGICRALGLEPGFETARMYRGPARPTGPAHYAVATLELG